MGLKFQPLLFSGFVSSSSGGSSPTIGGPITGGTDGSVLFVHPNGIIAQDNANFNFNDTTHQLTITGNLASATFNGYTPENLANKGVANGYAPLDGAAKIPVAFLPSVVMEYQGAWNPSTNTPALSDGTGTNGNVYYVTAAFAGPIAGLTDPSMHNFQIGDIVIYSSTVGKWQLTTPAAGVQSVNGFQGVVTLTQGNLTDSSAGADGITVTGGSNAVWGAGTSFAQQKSDATHNGYLASADWTTFNNKQSALTFGSISTSSTNLSIGSGANSTVGPNVTITLTGANLTDPSAGADGITIVGGSGAVLGSGTTISQQQSSGSQSGYLSSSDWTTFNNKANSNLGNLTTTAINLSLIPAANDSINLGATNKIWNTAYIDTIADGNFLAIDVTNRAAFGLGTKAFQWTNTGIDSVSHKIINVLDPTNPQDAATKNYVDSHATGGTVTSVALAAPAFLTVSGSPVTTSGTLTLTLASQTANTIFAAPNGSSGAPTFRALVAADIPFAPSASAGDLNETSFTAAASQTNQPVTGFAFANGIVRSFRALASVSTNGSTYAEFELSGIQKTASWELAYDSIGDSTGYSFSINGSGQILYTSGANTATIKFRAITTTV